MLEIMPPEAVPELRFPGLAPTGPLPEAIDFPLTRVPVKKSFDVLVFSDPQVRISPLQGTLTFEYVPIIGWREARLPLPYLLYALGALILIGVIILLVFVIRHRMQDAAFDRLFAGVAETRRRRKSIRPLILKVDSQNPNIGTRNIHPVPPSSKRSVGGDGSTFLIYYIPMPRRIGEIRNDGKKYSFVPRRPEFFPDLSKPLDHCLDKPIRAVASRSRSTSPTA